METTKIFSKWKTVPEVTDPGMILNFGPTLGLWVLCFSQSCFVETHFVVAVAVVVKSTRMFETD